MLKGVFCIKFFEFTKPLKAIVIAENKKLATTIYSNYVCLCDDDEIKMRKVSKEYVESDFISGIDEIHLFYQTIINNKLQFDFPGSLVMF